MADLHTEIVIPVHDQSRPVRRAAESVLIDDEASVLIVAHNIDPDLLDLPRSDRLRVIELRGDQGMPGATFDAGIRAATAPWVGIMGSDDWYEDGALQTMRKRAQVDGADGVIAPLAHQGGTGPTLKPLTWRHRNLDAVRDRMFFRTAPLGIYKKSLIDSDKYRFGNTFPAGSDMRVTALLWTSGASFSYYWDDPAYVVGRDAKTRVTFTPRSLAQTGRPWIALLDEPEVQAFSPDQKHALAYKMARVHVLDAVHLRKDTSAWLEGDLEWLSEFTQRLRTYDKDFDAPLSRRDAQVICAVESGDLKSVLEAGARWKNAPVHERALTASPVSMVNRNSPVRLVLSSIGARLISRLPG